MPLSSRPDHVAIAVPSVDDALARWQDALGGVVQWRFHTPTVFRGAALQFSNGSFLEMLMPSDADERTRMAGGPSGFVDAFLDRFGTRVHHVTLKVPELQSAIDELADAGMDTVDVSLDDPAWQEAFLRPSQIGGMIVQIAASNRSNEDWAAMNDHPLPGPPPDSAHLLGPQLRHDDLERAAEVWTLLGAKVVDDGDGLLASWPGEPLTVAIAPGERAAAVGLRVSGAAPRPSDPTLGPAVLGQPA